MSSFNREVHPNISVLVVIAHPDDELFVSGTICLLAASGFHLTLICATDGAGGHGRILSLNRASDACTHRKLELELSAKILGIADVIHLGQLDPCEIRTPEWRCEEVVERIASEMKTRDVQLVLTHGPDGGYGHPAHQLLYGLVINAANSSGFNGTIFSFCGLVPGTFFTWHMDEKSTLIVDGRAFHAQRSAAMGYHQSQLEYFVQPHLPCSIRKILSAIFGYFFWYFEFGILLCVIFSDFAHIA